MSKPFDATMKQLLDLYAADWLTWLCPAIGLPVPTTATPMDADLSSLSLAADKVFRVDLPLGGAVHIEAQSSYDAGLPKRSNLYNTIIGERIDGPVRTVVLLLRREADHPGMSGTYTESDESGDYRTFRYQVVRVWKQPIASFLGGPLGTLPMAMLTDEAASSVPGALEKMAERLSKAKPPEPAANQLWSAAFVLMGLRFDRSDVVNWFKGVQGMEESTTYQWILQQGEERGEKRGIVIGEERGIVIGEERGTLRARQTDILDALAAKFGAVPKDLETRVLTETDSERLRVALKSLFTIASIDEFTL